MQLVQPPSDQGGETFRLEFQRCRVSEIKVDFGSDGSIDWTVRGDRNGNCVDASTSAAAVEIDGETAVTLTATPDETGTIAYWVAAFRERR